MGAAFTNPFLIGGVTADNPVVTEEILGPVATFQVCDTEDEGLALAHHEITARGAADRLRAIGQSGRGSSPNHQKLSVRGLVRGDRN